jgi:SAM-dependent methyltransferase
MVEAWLRDSLACPDCRRPLTLSRACECGFPAAQGSPPDLRPRRTAERTVAFRLEPPADLALDGIEVERPPPTYRGPAAERDSRELFSAADEWMRPGSRLLDLGCGPRDQSVPAAHVGCDYVGVDFSSDRADVLADAHALPFRDASFDVVLSYAVLEHLHHPFVATREVARVLRTGGAFVGTVSQGEPFHDSYFHHTAWGVLSVLSGTGLEPTRIWPSYDTLHALAGMGRYPRVQRVLIEAVHRVGRWMPFLAPRRLLGWSPRRKAVDEIHRAAGLCFLAVRR